MAETTGSLKAHAKKLDASSTRRKAIETQLKAKKQEVAV
jgi:hypothetical protein